MTVRKGNREHELQKACVSWFKLQYPKLTLFAVPNGTKLAGSATDRARQGKRLKDEGLLPGVADLFLMAASGDLNGLWIEMKTPKGRQSDTQKAFEAKAIEQSFGYAMPRSFDEFRKVVNLYLKKGIY